MDAKTKLMVGKEALVDYCKEHPEYKYRSITKYVSNRRKEDPSLTDEQIIQEYFATKHSCYSKYLINGMTIHKYCLKVGKREDALYKRISRARKDPKYEGMSKSEIEQKVIADFFCEDAIDLIPDESYTLVFKPKEGKK